MLTKLKRQYCLDHYPLFPVRSYDYERDEEKISYPHVVKSYILTVPSKSFKGQVKTLGIELTKMAGALHADSLIFLGDNETPWRYQNNDFEPVREALEYLTFNKVGKKFNGALQVSASDLPTFTRHIAWLTRCNAALPYFYFTDLGKNILGSICKYGNLHLDALIEHTTQVLQTFVESSKFEFGDYSDCYNKFNKKGAISGRRFIV